MVDILIPKSNKRHISEHINDAKLKINSKENNILLGNMNKI